jgi:caa(3)-type oxidase subunit IV
VILIATLVALVVLAAASWLVAEPAVSLAIAAVKAVLIAWVFMELSHAHPVPRLVAVIAIGFIALLCAGTMADVALR